VDEVLNNSDLETSKLSELGGMKGMMSGVYSVGKSIEDRTRGSVTSASEPRDKSKIGRERIKK